MKKTGSFGEFLPLRVLLHTGVEVNLKYLIKKKFKNWLIYIFVLSLFHFIRSLPRAFAMYLMEFLSTICFYLLAKERRLTIKNLSRVFGHEKSPAEILEMAKKVFKTLGRNGAEIFQLKKTLTPDPYRYISIIGLDNLERALAKGKGVIILTGHIGCWELLGGFFPMIGYEFAAVGTRLYDLRLDAILVKNRASVGMKVIERSTGARQIYKYLQAGGLVGILIDQDTRVDSVFVDFMGKPTYTPVGPVTFALRLGTPIVPAAIHLQPDNRHELEVYEEIEIEKTGDPEQDRIINTQKCSKAIEKMIFKDPIQWVWLHDRWKTRPEHIVSSNEV
ncbi:lysophospholipid acyltransferase family protein [candidate division KSB1 bacterium]|nr:lysophospholipid acyltransferase family protein [candidate division KSB1 bacterium]